MNLTLKAMDWDLSVMRFVLDTQFNAGLINDPGFMSVSRTDDELTVVCDTHRKPAGAQKCVDGWKAFKVIGPLDFTLVGILSAIAGQLADNKISIYALSTFDTDIVLVNKDDFEKAKTVLAEKFTVI